MIEYPDQYFLDWWIEYIQEESSNIFLKKYLPKTDKEWVNRVLGVISHIKMQQEHGYIPTELHAIGSNIFYKINKAHNEIDGNKRSSIIVIYLYYLLNDYAILKAEDLRFMAKDIAKSKGRRNQNSWLKKINTFFSIRVTRLDV